MSVVIRSQQDLDRLNIQTAWQFADRLPAAAFEELCRVTVEQIAHDAEASRTVPVGVDVG